MTLPRSLEILHVLAQSTQLHLNPWRLYTCKLWWALVNKVFSTQLLPSAS